MDLMRWDVKLLGVSQLCYRTQPRFARNLLWLIFNFDVVMAPVPTSMGAAMEFRIAQMHQMKKGAHSAPRLV
jgi:hypothetical protein